jgi:hypothetical protein
MEEDFVYALLQVMPLERVNFHYNKNRGLAKQLPKNSQQLPLPSTDGWQL